MTWRTAKATLAHAAYVTANLREQDRLEVEAAGHDPVDATWFSLQSGPAKAIVHDDGRCAAIFGCVGVNAHYGRIWLLGTNDITQSAKPHLLRIARGEVEAFNRRWPVIGNLIDKRNTILVRWLDWLGFTIGNEVPVGPDRLPFLEFWRRAEDVCRRGNTDPGGH